ncbi:MAG: Cna B-type domain-containing protein, partial [Olegusella sp.]|nr:Cna B-type domain-containing protein [Olegusella sp.]
LLANGEDTGKTLTLSEDNNWSGEFSDLLVYDKGVAIAYTVQEDVPEGYTADVSGSATDGFTITNSHTPEKPHEEKPKSKQKKKHAIPQTSDPTSSTLIYTFAVSGLGMVTAGLYSSRRKRERK